MKRLVAVGLFLFAVSPLMAGQTVLFSDDFNDGVLDSSKWTRGIATGNTGGFSGSGSNVVEAGGYVHISQSSTNNGGRILSSEIQVDPTEVITITARMRTYAGNDYVSGINQIWSTSDGVPTARPLYWGHYNYTYSDRNWHGFGQAGTTTMTASTPAVWGDWFVEKIIYNPLTGEASYQVDDRDPIQLSASVMTGSTIILDYQFYGWFTGHYQDIDWVTVEASPAAVPAPAAVLLGGFGTTLVGWLKRRKSL